MKKDKFKRVASVATAVMAAMVMPFSAVACTQKEKPNATPVNTDEYNIPQDYARTYYEVFVRSFSDSNGDGIGDIRGLINNLDYLNDGDDSTTADLGVNGIWLMPINQSPSYHKYDVKDYYSIDSQYGTLDDFEELVAECEKRGIWVQMDLVLNHTSNQHKWFTTALQEARAGRDVNSGAMSKYCFVQQSTAPVSGTWYKVSGTSDYWYLGNFSSDMPDLNLSNLEVKAEIENIVDFWLNKGVRSFRLDAVPWAFANSVSYTEENGEFWTWFSEICDEKGREVYGESTPGLAKYCYNVGEVWDNSQSTIDSFFGTGMSCFNYTMAAKRSSGFIGAANGQVAAYRLTEKLQNVQTSTLDADPNAILSNFLSNHDNDRSGGYFGSDTYKIKQAAALYLLAPGNAYIYYGEEIGAKGSGRDENKRLSFNWGDSSKGITNSPSAADYTSDQSNGTWKSQTDDYDSILTFYRQTIKLRNRFPEIARGKIVALGIDANNKIATQESILANSGASKLADVNSNNKSIAIYSLTWNDSTIYIAHNIGDSACEIDISDLEGYEISGSLAARGNHGSLNGGKLSLPSGAVVLLSKTAVTE